jgi:methylase of polypeptide subunit release factors
LVEQSPARLAPGGRIVFEFGYGQAEAVTRLIEQAARLDLLEVRNDLQGVPRVAVATRAGA